MPTFTGTPDAQGLGHLPTSQPRGHRREEACQELLISRGLAVSRRLFCLQPGGRSVPNKSWDSPITGSARGRWVPGHHL